LIFRGACAACNSAASPGEEQLIRCAPESFLLARVNPVVERSWRGKGQSRKGSRGRPAPTIRIDCGSHSLSTRLIDGTMTVASPDQLVVKDRNQIEHPPILLFPEMTAKGLKSKLSAIGPVSWGFLHADARYWPKYANLIRELFPKSNIERLPDTPAGSHDVKLVIRCVVGPGYWQAIAKTAFHYFLQTSCRGIRGDEDEFSAIRTFIQQGGNREPFFSNPRTTFVVPSYGAPSTWVHFLAAEESGDGNTEITALVCLFMGPEYRAPMHHVRIGKIPSRLVLPWARSTHTYVYDEVLGGGAYAGKVMKESLTRLR
jgi:hypothetical protein